MNVLGRRELLSFLAAIGGATAASSLPTVAFGQSGRNAITITFGDSEIEIIIPFFPEMPPRGDMIEIGVRVNARRGGGNFTYRMPSAQVMRIAESVGRRGVRLSSRTERGRVRGEFSLRDGEIVGSLAGLREGGEGGETGVQTRAAPAIAAAVAIVGIGAGAIVAIVGIVAVVGVVKILAQSGGGSVSVTAETSAGDVDVEVGVGR